jgi:heme/copper-type cytochrome/quinol oxidase subunit 2
MDPYTANVYPPVPAPSMHEFVPSPEIHKIRDWLPWSIINIFLGWFLLGIIATVCSIVCRNRKRENNVQGARSMSTLALVINIISTLIGIVAWIGLIVYIVVVVRATKYTYNPSRTGIYSL